MPPSCQVRRLKQSYHRSVKLFTTGRMQTAGCKSREMSIVVAKVQVPHPYLVPYPTAVLRVSRAQEIANSFRILAESSPPVHIVCHPDVKHSFDLARKV
jgi:hypothetical protein